MGRGLVQPDSDSVQLTHTPIVSMWKPQQQLLPADMVVLDRGESTPVSCCDKDSNSSPRSIWHGSHDQLLVCIDSPDHVTFSEERAESSSSECQNGTSEDDTSMTAEPSFTMKVLSPNSEVRKPIRKSYDQRRGRRRVPIRGDAFKQDLMHTGQSTNGDEGYNHEQESGCDEEEVRVIFPRVDFNSKKRTTRRGKKGEEHSLGTHRRRKLRAFEIRSAMVGEKEYIAGLCILNKSKGKTIGCKLKSQM